MATLHAAMMERTGMADIVIEPESIINNEPLREKFLKEEIEHMRELGMVRLNFTDFNDTWGTDRIRIVIACTSDIPTTTHLPVVRPASTRVCTTD